MRYGLMRIIAALLLVVLTGARLAAAEWFDVGGTVTDSLTGEPLPYATVYLQGARIGGLTDEEGRFHLSASTPFTSVRAALMGYETRVIAVDSLRQGMRLDIALRPQSVELGEVEKHGRKSRYSKRDNPAVEFARRIREKAAASDPRRHDGYHYDKYERITLALNDYTPDMADSLGRASRRFGWMDEYVDTSEVTGRPILNVAMREKASMVGYSGGERRELVEGLSGAGVDEVLPPESLQTFYDEILGEIDIYDSEISLLRRSFVSPLARVAPDFYRFYLTDTVRVGADSCIELSFVPRNTALPGFRGRLYVGLTDPEMRVRRIEMSVPREVNLNFVDNLRIAQDYATSPDGSRLKLSDDLVVEARLMPGTPGIYARRISTHTGHSFVRSAQLDSLFSASQMPSVTASDATDRDSLFWQQRRTAAISRGELEVERMMARLRRERLFRLAEGGLRIISEGYVGIGGKGAKVAYGPVINSVGLNSLEGFRMRVGGMTTAQLSRRWFGSGYVAYGFRDRRFKYGAEVEYSFRDKKYNAREFPVHSLRVESTFDTEWLGDETMHGAVDAMWFSTRFERETQIIYNNRQSLVYTLETPRRLALTLRLDRADREATPLMAFRDGRGREFSHFLLNSATLQLRFAPGERLLETRMGRTILPSESPLFVLSQTVAPKGVAGNRFAYASTTLDVARRFRLPAFGYIAARLKGGHIWTRSPYPVLFIPPASLSYFRGTSSFGCLSPLEFINDSYVRLDLTYHAEGALLGQVPFLRLLKLREVVGWKGLMGHLSERNRPELHPDLFAFPEVARATRMGSRPYMEAFVGVENIMRLFRVDYVWRLTYRDTPGACRGMVRIGIALSF